jgi:hypothetical protein
VVRKDTLEELDLDAPSSEDRFGVREERNRKVTWSCTAMSLQRPEGSCTIYGRYVGTNACRVILRVCRYEDFF